MGFASHLIVIFVCSVGGQYDSALCNMVTIVNNLFYLGMGHATELVVIFVCSIGG